MERTRLKTCRQKNTLKSRASSPGRPPHPVYVLLRVVRRVELYDPVHVRDVQSPGGHVGAEQGALIGVAVLEEGRRALGLLLLALLFGTENVA